MLAAKLPDVVLCASGRNFFASLPSANARSFVDLLKATYGPKFLVTDPQEASVMLVQLWAQVSRVWLLAQPSALTLRCDFDANQFSLFFSG